MKNTNLSKAQTQSKTLNSHTEEFQGGACYCASYSQGCGAHTDGGASGGATSSPQHSPRWQPWSLAHGLCFSASVPPRPAAARSCSQPFHLRLSAVDGVRVTGRSSRLHVTAFSALQSTGCPPATA